MIRCSLDGKKAKIQNSIPYKKNEYNDNKKNSKSNR